MFKLTKNWCEILSNEFNKEYYIKLCEFLDREYAEKVIYPKAENVFNALNACPYNNVKVVIIGQDPYHEPNQAHGLSFSVEKDVVLPPSLKNIYKEIEAEFGYSMPKSNGNLSSWAKQGVLLLNSVLTVQKGLANSHKGKGWEQFTSEIVKQLNRREKPLIFILWGNGAKNVGAVVDKNKHFVLSSAHPSPLSAYNGFFGCNHFKKANEILESLGEEPINWKIN